MSWGEFTPTSSSIILLYRAYPLVCLKTLVLVPGNLFHAFNVISSHLFQTGDLGCPFDQWDPRQVGGPTP